MIFTVFTGRPGNQVDVSGPLLSRDGSMSETRLSQHQAGLSAVIAEGGGDWDARRTGLTAHARYGPGTGTALRELEEPRQPGLVVRDDSRPGAGGGWKVTATARPYLEDHDDVPRPREGGLD
jgi:hypothetical protein